MKFIDFRLRPPADGFMPIFPPDWVKLMAAKFGFGRSASYEQKSISKCIAEMDEAGIAIGVVMGRNNLAASISNDEIAKIKNLYPDRLVGFAGIDPLGALHRPVEEIERCVRDLGLKGVHMDQCWVAGKFRKPIGMYADDTILYPIYEKCLELNVPVVLLTGALAGRDISYSDPVAIMRVAFDFPKLKIVVGHGAYPHVTEIIGAAFKQPNIFISPDMYVFAPGGQQYIEAANGILQDQMLFASAYPLAPLKESVERVLKLGLKESMLEKFAYKNAASLLGIT